MRSKTIIISILALIILTAASKFSSIKKPDFVQHISRENALQNRQVIQCSPNWENIDEDDLAKSISILPGWGNYRWNISTQSDSARFYFNQGINMYYAFHIIESMASFKKAALFDTDNAMIYWAQALAYGPNINDFAYAATPEAYAAIQKATTLKSNCSAKEKVLIDAMAVRYSDDSTVSRKSLNQLYADAMKQAHKQFSQDGDIAALYADALMLQHPWDYWKHNGDAQPWTPEITNVLENILKIHPLHPGANHYYIHSIEASPKPIKAITSADRLGRLMPGVAHMVHMPSHIYIRTGNYQQGIKVNELSVNGYNNYLALYPDVQNNAPLYFIHNLHMQSACAMMKANYGYSNRTATQSSRSFDTAFLSLAQPMGNFVQYVYMTDFINNVRFGKWDCILSAPAIQDHHIYANVLWHWARGMAFAGKKNLEDAATELLMMQQKMKAPDMFVVMQPFNSPNDAAKVAEKILEGTIASRQKDYKKAVSLLEIAVADEDAMVYNEPKDWLIPARHYLGNTLLLAGEAVKAEKIFKEDLKENPDNHWALSGLYKALLLQKKNAEAITVHKRFLKAFAGSDIEAAHAIF